MAKLACNATQKKSDVDREQTKKRRTSPIANMNGSNPSRSKIFFHQKQKVRKQTTALSCVPHYRTNKIQHTGILYRSCRFLGHPKLLGLVVLHAQRPFPLSQPHLHALKSGPVQLVGPPNQHLDGPACSRNGPHERKRRLFHPERLFSRI